MEAEQNLANISILLQTSHPTHCVICVHAQEPIRPKYRVESGGQPERFAGSVHHSETREPKTNRETVASNDQ